MSSGESAPATASDSNSSASTSNSTTTTAFHPEAGQQPHHVVEITQLGGAPTESPPPDAPSPPQQHPREMASSGDGPTETPQQDAASQPRQGLGKIPRVRALLHLVAGDQFTPQTVLIGPYHQEKEGSCSFLSTRLKEEAFQEIEVKHNCDPEHLQLKLCDLVVEVMNCYTYLPRNSFEDIEFKKAFIKMLLYDGCYLLSFFLNFRPAETSAGAGTGSSNHGASSSRSGGGHVGGADDRVILFNDSILVRDILYLLENQIPLCVLETILEFLRPTSGVNHTLELISNNVRSRLHEQRYISKDKKPVPAMSMSKPSDLLHLVYSYFRRETPAVATAQKEEPCLTGRWHSATEYRKYNVQFRCRKFQDGKEWSILELHLQGGTLEIPFLRVGAHTWTMLRSLMALEEKEVLRPVTAYCVFLSQVACNAEDVQLLRRAKVLEHFMPSDKEAAQAFAYLSNGVALDIDNEDQNYLKPMWHRLDKRCNSRMCNFMGIFCERNCKDVFLFFAFIVGLLLFLSEVAQGIYSGLGYHRPTHS